MTRSRTRTWISIAALLTTGALGAVAPVALAQSAQQGLIARGAPPDLFLLYSGDVIGYLGPCG